MKRSKKISINIKRAVKELDEANCWGIGNVIFAEIIRVGIAEYEEKLEHVKDEDRMLISKKIYLDVIDILKKYIE